jgi:ABC-type transporter Mla subunit MlaD
MQPIYSNNKNPVNVGDKVDYRGSVGTVKEIKYYDWRDKVCVIVLALDSGRDLEIIHSLS